MTIYISLSDFADFIMRPGISQLTKVKELAQRNDYHPYADFWKGPREAIQRFHASGGRDRTLLDQALSGLIDRKKMRRHPEAIAGYKKFLGKKKIEYFKPHRGDWSYEDLKVRINPDLGLVVGANSYEIKLYFKEGSIDKNKLKLVFALMRTCIPRDEEKQLTMAVIDVNTGKLYAESHPDPALVTLLEAQAKAFIHMWKSLGKVSPSPKIA